MESSLNPETLFSLWELSSEVMAVLTEDGRFLHASPSWERHLGFSSEELSSKPFFELIHPEDLSRTQLEIYRLVKESQKGIFDSRVRNKKQDIQWFRWAWQPLPSTSSFLLSGRDITELKAMEKDLVENREKFKQLNESSIEGVAIHDKGVILEANEALARIFGFEKSRDMIGKNGLDFTAPEYRPIILANIQKGYAQPYEVVGLRKDGSRFDCLISGRTITYQGREVRVSTFLDITPLKKREQELFESQELFRKLAEASQDGIAVSEKGKILMANPALARMFGCEVSDMVGRNAVEFTAPESRETLLRKVLEEVETKYEVMGLRRDGSRFPVEITPRMTTYQGRRVRVGYFRDISLRKKFEEEFHHQKDFNQSLINSSMDGLMAFDRECRYTLWNPAIEKMTGHSREEVLGKCAFDVFPFLKAIGQDRYFYEALEGKTAVTKDRPFRTPAGKQGFFEAFYSPLRNPQGEIMGGLGIIHDVTERKRMEENLHQSQFNLKAVFQNTFQSIILMDREGRIQTYNDNAADAFWAPDGHGLEAGRPLLDYLPRGLSQDFPGYFKRTLRGEANQFERQTVLDEEEQWLEVGYNPVFDEEGEIEGVCFTCLNIDDRKKAAAALQKSEANLRSIFNSGHEAIILADLNGVIQDFNPNAEKYLVEFRGQELKAGRNLGDYVEPEYLEAYQERFKRVLKGEVVHLERPVKKVKGGAHWFEFNYNPAFDEQGRVIGVCLMVGSIEERKRAEEALQKSEADLRTLFNSVKQNIVLLDSQRKIQNFNQAAEETFRQATGKKVQIGKDFLDYVRPEDQEKAVERLEKALHGETVRVERPYRFADGVPRWIEYTYHPVINPQGHIQGVCFTSQSIDDRKAAEQALRESEEKFRKIFEDASIGMTLVDKDFRFLHVNQAFCQLVGYTAEELTRMTFRDITYAEDLPKNIEMAHNLTVGKGFHMQKRYRHKNGSIVWGNLTVTSLVDERGETLCSVGMVEDISDHKRSEILLQESEEKFRRIFEDASTAMAMVNDYKFLKVNRAFQELLGYQSREIEGKTLFEITHPDDMPRTNDIATGMHQGEREQFHTEKRYVRKDGQSLWANVSGTLIRDASGNKLYSLIMIENITDRKKAQEALRKSEQDLRTVFDSGSQMIVLIGQDGRVGDYNRNADIYLEKMTGAKFQKGRLFSDYMTPQVQGIFQDWIQKVLNGESISMERSIQAKNGVEHWFEMNFTPVRDGDGKVTGVCMSSTLIDERKQAEEALRKSERDLKAVFDSGSQVTILIDRDGRIHGFNKSATVLAPRVLGRGIEKGMLFADTLPPGASLKIFQESFAAALEGRETKGERAIRSAEGMERWVEVNYQPVFNDQGVVEEVCFSLVFIDERKKTERDLMESQERFQRLVQLTQEGVLIHENPTIVDVNPALAAMLGYQPEEMIGKSGFDFLEPESHDTARRYMTEKSPKPYEALARRKDGSRFPVELQGRNLSYKGKEVRVLTVHDLTWRKEAERILTESEDRYRRLIELSPEAVVVHAGGKVLYVNPAGVEMFGAGGKNVEGLSLLEFLHPEDRDLASKRIQQILETGKSTDWTELKLVRSNGAEFPAETKGTPFLFQGIPAVLTIVRDVSERKKSQQTLLRYERLAAIGKVIAAIAHEIRNPLTVLAGMSQALKLKFAGRPEFAEEVDTILIQAERLRLFMTDILDYSRELLINKKEVDLRETMERSLRLVQSQVDPLKASVQVDWNWDKNLPLLWADGERLEQILVNLILNAYQSMGRKGKLILSGHEREGWIRLGVEDDGSGVSEADLPRLFEPFFTTKKHGSGLGLPISQKIVEAHGGKIEVKRIQPHGTLFTVQLPTQRT